ncbi:MAG: hypothetical protein LBJ80_00135 [Rickettsiales bacterium]|jgi:hypothetical protein|nr:hypothetical protein [Rickettsiales bacterium]
MGKQISLEVESTNVKGSAGGVPRLEAVSPATNTISMGGLLTYPGIQAKMNLNDTQIAQGRKILSDKYNSLARTYAANSLITINADQVQASTVFLKNNPSANGYAQFMADSYNSSLSREMENAPDSLTRELIESQGKVTIYDGVEAARKKELAIKTDYVLSQTEQNRQVFLQQVYDSPYNANALRLQYESSLLAVREFIPEKFASYRRKALAEFSYSTMTGLIESNPSSALKILKNQKAGGELLADLDQDDRQRLVKYADQKIEEIQAKTMRELSILETAQNNKERNTYWDYRYRIESGEGSKAEIEALPIKNQYKAELLHSFRSFEKAQATKEQEINKCLTMRNENQPNLETPEKVVVASYQQVVDEQTANRKAIAQNPGAVLSCLEKAKIAMSFRSDKTFDPLCQDIIIALERGSVDEAIDASLAIKLLQQNDAHIIKALDNRYLCMASEVVWKANVQQSVPYKQRDLVEKARDSYLKYSSREDIKQRQLEFNNEGISQGYLNQVIAGIKDTTWFIPNKVDYEISTTDSQLLKRDAYNSLRNQYVSGLTGDLAAKAAIDTLKGVWGPSAMNGINRRSILPNQLVLTMNPPEKVYKMAPDQVEHQAGLLKQDIAEFCVAKLGEKSPIRPIDFPIADKSKAHSYINGIEKKINESKSTLHTAKEANHNVYALINDEWVKRKLFLKSQVGNEGHYYAVYFEDEANFLGPHVVVDPTGESGYGSALDITFDPLEEANANANQSSK